MNRRDLIILLGGAAVGWPLVARAQQKAMPVIGFLHTVASPKDGVAVAFRQGLSETGYVEGQNVAIEYRSAEGNYDRLPELAADLVRRNVDLIATGGGTPSARAAKNATSTIPIVFVFVSNPVQHGLIASLARPGGNATGFGGLDTELTPKRLELLSELVPRAKVIALLANPSNPTVESLIPDAQEAARTKGVQLPILKATTEGEIDAAFASLAQLQARALVVGTDGFFNSRNKQLVALALRFGVPAISSSRQFAAAGGLISYGANFLVAYRQAGIYAGRILKGERPADLPVQQPNIFELVINLKTANALGLTVPQSLLARADEVIE